MYFYRNLFSLFILLLSAMSTASAQYPEPPDSPGPEAWPFLTDLAAPIQWRFHWTRETPSAGEVSLRGGVRVEAMFPDPDGVLETAYQDLDSFFASASIPRDGAYRIVTEKMPTDTFETFQITVTDSECRIQANDTEGIRRGIFYLEDELLRAEGPFLKPGVTQRKPFIRNRISRCFFGPIKREPKFKDELMDAVDYYPEHYLNKIAHDGVNGLWLTIEFKDIVQTSLTPVVDPGRAQRLAKLRATVAKCRRYGIEVFLFCIEPRVMDPDHPLLQAHPEIGSKTPGTGRLFCPFPEAGQKYLYEAMNDIFTQVPGLGGLINISFGERSTTCLSGADEQWKLLCPTCSTKSPGEILKASLAAMERGMHTANPKAQFISWLYVPENGTGPQRDLTPLRGMAKHTPPGVICQINFESGGEREQLGKARHVGDYWLSYIGPSAVYLDVAAGVAESEGELGAKLQACNSFEVSTVPHVPVPGNLYQKYAEMRRLGVTSVMQCWYIGSLPSVMNRAAASELAFAPEGQSEEDFLLRLAQRDWGAQHAPAVVHAWKLFAGAYSHYPLTNAFQYYGPMHDGIGWPLHLKPVHNNLSPVWKLEYPPSGDRIGECFSGSHSLAEMLELCGRLSEGWQEGLKVLRALKPQFEGDPNRLLDLANAEALGIHFRTGYNILRFYELRERLLYGDAQGAAALLEELRAIVNEEVENTAAMVALCAQNPYLGFQAEAEGYKYFPGRLRWREAQLREILASEFAEAEGAIAAGEPPFPELTGLAESSLRYAAVKAAPDFVAQWTSEAAWSAITKMAQGPHEPVWSWKATHDDNAIYVNVVSDASPDWRPVAAVLHLEPSQIYPRRTFRADPNGKRDLRTVWLGPDSDWEAACDVIDGQQHFRYRIPMEAFEGEADPQRPMRVNVELTFLSTDKKTQMVRTWAPAAEARVLPRLGYGGANPAEMGWLVREW